MTLTAVGVDLGGTKIAAALVDERGQILRSIRVRTDVSGGPKAVLRQISITVKSLTSSALPASVIGMGVGVAGQIEPDTGLVHFAPNLDWHEVPLQAVLGSELGLPVVVTNDVRAITWGEWLFGAGKSCSDLICCFVGTGIGGGVVVNGQILNGCSNSAAEIGHIVVDLNGPRCTCGNHGCMEALAGGWGIAQRAREAVSANSLAGARLLQLAEGGAEAITARKVVEAYRESDELARQLLAGAEQALTAGMISLVNAFNPCRLILGGGVLDGLPEWVERVEKGINQRALKAATGSLQVVTAKLGDEAGVIGAAALAMRSLKK